MARRKQDTVSETTLDSASAVPAGGRDELDEQLAEQLKAHAQAHGACLVGPDGLLRRLTKLVLETGLEAEMDEHLGYEAHDPAGRNSGNFRNGTRAKTVLTDVGPVEIEVPRDRDASFTPALVRKRQRRLTGVDDMVISLVAKGLTTGEVSAYLAEVYGAQVSKDTISRITDRVLEGLSEWQNRPLDPIYPVVFIDAIHVKIRDGHVADRPVYTAIGVNLDGERDILGLWVGGVADVCIVVCDGLKGLPESIAATWPAAVTQTCVIHLLRNSFRDASRRDWAGIARDLRLVYTAPTEAAALDRFVEFTDAGGGQYPAIIATGGLLVAGAIALDIVVCAVPVRPPPARRRLPGVSVGIRSSAPGRPHCDRRSRLCDRHLRSGAVSRLVE
jgi:putative transposase